MVHFIEIYVAVPEMMVVGVSGSPNLLILFAHFNCVLFNSSNVVGSVKSLILRKVLTDICQATVDSTTDPITIFQKGVQYLKFP